MEHFLKKTTSVSSSMNQSGGSPSDIKSPPLLSHTITGSKTSNTLNQVEQRPASIYTSPYRPQLASSTFNSSKLTTNDISQIIQTTILTVTKMGLARHTVSQKNPKSIRIPKKSIQIL